MADRREGESFRGPAADPELAGANQPPARSWADDVLIRVSRPSELGPTERDAWNGLQRDLGCPNPFLSFDFALAADRCRASTRVAVLEDAGVTVGFLPFDRGLAGRGRPIAPGMSDCQALVASPELALSTPQLLRSCRLNSLELDHFWAGSSFARNFRGAEKPSAVVGLSGGYASYLAERKRRGFFKTVAYKRRKFERDFGPLRFTFGAGCRSDLATLLRWKSEQYRRTGRHDRFVNKWVVELIEQVAAMNSLEARGVFCGLYLDERLIAGEFSITSHRYLSSWLPSYDTEFARYSPGSIATLLLLQEADASGIDQVDLGKGDEPYKGNYKTHDIPLVDGYVRRPNALGLGWAAQRAARSYPIDFVLRHHALRVAARRTLERSGQLRPRPHRDRLSELNSVPATSGEAAGTSAVEELLAQDSSVLAMDLGRLGRDNGRLRRKSEEGS